MGKLTDRNVCACRKQFRQIVCQFLFKFFVSHITSWLCWQWEVHKNICVSHYNTGRVKKQEIFVKIGQKI